ncbi:Alginate export domain-containing protein [Candidatus Electrothrix laxa]
MSGLPELLLAGLLGITPELGLENTNIAGYDRTHLSTDYNRIRANLSLSHKQNSNLAATLIVDNETSYTTSPNELDNELDNEISLYRAYGQYQGERHFWSVGKQRIPLGVGRIWNPIDIFNPADAQAIETGERTGTDAIRYEYALSELSNADLTIADGKAAIRLKGYLEYADIGLIVLRDNSNDRNMLWGEDASLDIIGWELEGRLPGTSIELRSEGGRLHNRETGDVFTEFILGAEYGFADSLTLLGEYRYSDQDMTNQLAIQSGFQPAMLWTCQLLLLTDLNDGSVLIAPSVTYSLSDEMTLSAGGFIATGDATKEFPEDGNRCYLSWFVHF